LITKVMTFFNTGIKNSYLIAFLCLIATTGPAGAHHSNAFYTDEMVEITGELIEVSWRNPHSMFFVRSEGNDGEEVVWKIEGNSVFNYIRSGITRALFPINASVTVIGFQSSRDKYSLEGANMLLPGGQEILLWENRSIRFSDQATLVAEATEEVVDTISENKGIFRVWSSPRGIYWGQQMANQPLTEASIANRASFDMLDNFATRCEGEGMPRIMLTPHPFEFEDQGDEIKLRAELYDTERTVYMGNTATPADILATKLGYSVGAWEGSTLVVTTTNISWPFFDNRGSTQSEAVKIVERFSLSDDQGRLDFETTVTDPPNLQRPAVLKGYWLALGHTLPIYNCQLD
jgi:hypothetical protein